MTIKKHIYDHAGQRRVLKVMLALFGHEIDGIAPGQIAKAVGISPGNVTRDLHNLVEAGIAERLPHNDHARISPRMGQKALAILNNIDSAAKRVDEARNRYTRET